MSDKMEKKEIETRYRYGITAIDKTISNNDFNKVLWLFENEQDRLNFLILIYKNRNYANIQLVEFDRQITYWYSS